jgi:hypothetical protein
VSSVKLLSSHVGDTRRYHPSGVNDPQPAYARSTEEWGRTDVVRLPWADIIADLDQAIG